MSAAVVPKDGPGRTCHDFAAALNEGDYEGAAIYFSRGACLLTPDATAVYGRASIRAVLAQLVASRPRILVESSSLLGGENVALVRQRWRTELQGPDGAAFDRVIDPVLALCRIEGRWKLAIAAPWGWGGEDSRQASFKERIAR